MMGVQFFKTRRSLRSLTCCALLLLAPHAAFAFNFSVNGFSDAVDLSPGDGICDAGAGTCTLRAAFQESNAWPGKDIISIPDGTYILSLSGLDDSAAVGDLDITDPVSLRGAGQITTIIDAAGIDRVIDIHSVDVDIESLTIRNGLASGVEGGGIRNVDGTLTIKKATLHNNQTTGNGFGGGAIYNTGPLIIDGTTIHNNRSSRGGGVLHFNRDMTITNSTIHTNTVDLGAGSGGGIFIQSDATSTISNTTIRNNLAALGGGGGIYSVFGFTLINSTVNNNNALLVGGGGIYDIGLGVLSITNSTISYNDATGLGGGIHTRRGTATITNSTIYKNRVFGIHDAVQETYNGHGGGIFLPTGYGITLTNTIISDNTASVSVPAGANCYSQSDGGVFSTFLSTSLNSISDDNTCNLIGSGDQPNTGLSLNGTLTAALGLNGGPTLTHSINAPGPGVDLGTNTGCPATDQRNFPRPVNGGSSLTCDIGSVELDPAAAIADLSVRMEETMDPAINGGNFSYNITVTNHGPDPANNVTLTDLLSAGLNYVSNNATCNTGALPTISCALGTMNPGDVQTISITVNPTTPGQLTNTASVAATEGDPNAANNSVIELTDVSGSSDLSASIVGSINPAIANVNMNYTVTIVNNGPNTATNVTPTIQFDTNTTITTAIPSIGTCTTSGILKKVTCDLGDLVNGANASITIYIKPVLMGSITNNVYASFNGSDPNMANNAPSITTTVDANAALSITSSEAPDPAFQNADIFYDFTVTNSGPSTTHDTALVVTFPTGMSLSPAQGAAPNNCSGGAVVTCNLGSMIGSSSKTVTLVAIASTTGMFTVNATATSNETTAALGSESTLVNPAPTPAPPTADLAITMTDAADPVVVGNSITYNINAANANGPNVAQSVIVTVTLPSAATFASASAGCSHSGGIVSCNIGALALGNSVALNVTADTTITGIFEARATISDIVGTDPALTNNSVTQSTKVNATGSGATTASGANSGGGNTGKFELAALFLIALLLFNRRTTSQHH